MIVANRYAKSLIELAQEANQLEKVRSDMKFVLSICNNHRDFALFLKSPIIKTDKKITVLQNIFNGQISEMSLSFLKLITQKNRESIVPEIAQAFEEQYKTNNNIFTAIVTSSNGLDASTKQKVTDLIKSQLKGEVELIEKLDKNTIGGFVLTIGDRQIDKTVARQLNNMKKQLLNKTLN